MGKKRLCANLANLANSESKLASKRLKKVCESPKFQEGGSSKDGTELKPASEACASSCCGFCPGRPKPEKKKFLYKTKDIVDDEGNPAVKPKFKRCKFLLKKTQEEIDLICNTTVEFESDEIEFEQAAEACNATCAFDCE